MFNFRLEFLSHTHLHNNEQQHKSTNTVHHASIVGHQGLTATSGPDVEVFSVVVIAVVSGVVGQVMLDAGARGARVAAAEGNAFHQVFAFHVALDTAKKFQKDRELSGRIFNCINWSILGVAFKISGVTGLETYLNKFVSLY